MEVLSQHLLADTEENQEKTVRLASVPADTLLSACGGHVISWCKSNDSIIRKCHTHAPKLSMNLNGALNLT
jgi:hypothetical protein